MLGHVYAIFRRKSASEMLISGSIVDREMQYPTFATKEEAERKLCEYDGFFFVDLISFGR